MRAGFYLGAAGWQARPTVALLALAAALFGQAARAETLTLAECLRETVEHNPSIIQQRLILEQAGGQRLSLRSRAFPQLLLSGVGGQQGQQTSETLEIVTKGAGGKKTTTTLVSPRPERLFLIGSEALYQPIFDAAIPASWRRGDLEIASARSNFLVVATAELHAARTEFFSALFQQQNGVILAGIADNLTANAKGMGQLLNAGLAGRQSLLAAQVQQANFAPGIIAATGSLRDNLTGLLQTMGRPLGPGSDPVKAVTLADGWEDGPLDFDAAAATREARSSRPDLLALRDLIRSYQEDARITRGGYYPLVRIYVTGDLLPGNFVQSQRPNAVRPSDDTQQTEIRPGVREDWNIIDTGAVQGSAQQLDRLREAVAISLQHLEQDIPGELAAIRAQADRAAKQRELFQANVDLSASTLQIVQSGVTQGTNSQLEFLDAETSVLSTRIGLLSSRLQMSLAHAEYDRATGGYLRFIGASQAAASAAPK